MITIPQSPQEYGSTDLTVANILALAQAHEANQARLAARIDPTTPQRRAAYERRRDAERRMPPMSRCEGR